MTVKESIERCKQIVKDNNEIIKEARKNGDINTMNLTASLDNDSIAIDTVTQALEQKDKEIQELKADLYECNNIISDYIDTVKEKDKIIGLMAEYMEEEFAEYQLDNIYAELYNCNGMERNWTRGKEKEIEDIIKYFQKKARKENE